MLIWSGWGIAVAIFAAIGLLLTFALHDLAQQWLPYGPAGSVSLLIGGGFAALSIFLLARWRERRGTGSLAGDALRRRRAHANAGSLFFIPTRFWTWIVAAVALALAVLQFSASPT